MTSKIRATRRHCKIIDDIQMLYDVIRGIFHNGRHSTDPKYIQNQLQIYVFNYSIYKELPQKYQLQIQGYIDAFNDINS